MSDLFSKVGIDLGVVVLLLIVLIIVISGSRKLTN